MPITQPLPGPTLPILGQYPYGNAPYSTVSEPARLEWHRLADLHERQARRAADWEKEMQCVAAQLEIAAAQREVAAAMREFNLQNPPTP